MSVYLDHAATTPMRQSAREAWLDQAARGANPSSLHSAGREARAVVEESREIIAEALGARPSEVIFTSGGTEADNLAIKGTYAARESSRSARQIVTTGMEHHAVLDPVEHLVKTAGASVAWLEPDRLGVVSADDLEALLASGGADTTALVSVMWANNEVGTIAPIDKLAAIARSAGVPFHTDAVQAAAAMPIDFEASGADLMSVTAHKLGGPVGVGALLARRDATLVPLAHGGGQERQVRSGTIDAAGIRAFAVALREARDEQRAHADRLVALRDRLITSALALDLGISVSGAWTQGGYADRLPNNAHLVVPGCEGDSLLYLLDAAGIECSTGSACQAGIPQPSHVLLAMGYPVEQARGALRLSLGHTSTDADVDAFVAALPAVVERARRAAGAA